LRKELDAKFILRMWSENEPFECEVDGEYSSKVKLKEHPF